MDVESKAGDQLAGRLAGRLPGERLDLPDREAWRTWAALASMAAALLLALHLNRKLVHLWPLAWIAAPLALAAALARARYVEAERPVLRLWRWVGALSAFYALVHYPLMPARPDPASQALLAGIVVLWLGAVACGVLCFRIPSLAVVPPAYLLWSKLAAGAVTGLPHGQVLDIAPLPEVALGIGLGLLIGQTCSRFAPDQARARAQWAQALLLVAIGIHLANYFWSFMAKMTLPGPPLAWLRQNNPANMFAVAADNGHLFLGESPGLFQAIDGAVSWLHPLTNLGVLLAQGLAITAFFLPRRGILLLLAAFDLMHGAIILVAGADFWPWIFLNVAVAAVVAGRDFVRPAPAFAFAAALFVLVSPRFVNVAQLGWYDTLANNKLFFLAEDLQGRRYYVPTNYFTFYSYPLGHMDYGFPDPRSAFVVGSPNGGAYTYATFKAGLRCDVPALTNVTGLRALDPAPLDEFVRNYHRLALREERRLGTVPYNIYPHHFYVQPRLGRDFHDLEKRNIRAYIYRRESVCLTRDRGVLARRVISSAEHRIDVR